MAPFRDTDALSLCAIVVSVCAYLIHFQGVKGRVEPWGRTPAVTAIASNLHFLLFCALPCLGAGYGRVIHGSAHAADPIKALRGGLAEASKKGRGAFRDAAAGRMLQAHGAHAELAAEELCAQSYEAQQLLSLSCAAFLVISAAYSYLTVDPEGELAPRIPVATRTGMRFASAVLNLLTLFFPCGPWPAASIVPVVMVATAAFQIWAVQPANPTRLPIGLYEC